MVSKSLLKFAAALVALSASAVSAIELADQTAEAILVAEGTDVVLQCTGDVGYEFCKWTLADGQTCLVTAGSSDEACSANPRLTWDNDEARCALTIPTVARATDLGAYTCQLVDADLNSVEASIAVDVAVPATTHFGADFEGEDPEEAVPVKAGELVIVECHATGGYPDPVVSASLGEDPSLIDEENDVLLEFTENANQRQEMEDGTVDLVSYVSFMPTMADCGKYVKCEAIQKNEDGELLFDHGSDLKARKIMVTFPPTPLADQLGPFPYSPEDEEYQDGQPLTVSVTFMANPVPMNNEAIWHFTTGEGEDADVMVLRAEDSHNTKYSALPLEYDGHSVTATLEIYELSAADADIAYSLRVQTSEGENTYTFALIYDVEHVYTTEATRPDFAPEETEAKKGGLSGGTIAAIVIVVLAIVVGLAISGWAKSNGRMCFASNQNPTQRGKAKEEKAMKKAEAEQKKKDKLAKKNNKPKKGKGNKADDVEAGLNKEEEHPLQQPEGGDVSEKGAESSEK